MGIQISVEKINVETKQLIELLLQDNHYSINALVRKTLPIKNERLTQVIFNYDHP